MKKILIISLSAGAGHTQVAEAIRQTALEDSSQIQITHIDLADYLSLPARKTVTDTYALMVKKIPSLFGLLYDKTNDPKLIRRYNSFSRQIKKYSSLRLFQFIREYDPDAIVCTHFLPADHILNTTNNHLKNIPIYMVVTDYDWHSLWFVPDVLHYFVANKQIAWKMHYQGVPEENITISGIPVRPIFNEDKPLAELQKKYCLPNNNHLNILFLSGGEGLVNITKAINTLFNSTIPLNIVAIAGKNKLLENKLKKINPPTHINLTTLGWTDSIDEYMRLADIIITKPGGSTISECLNLNKQMLIIDPIPGQEEHNADYILANDWGQIARTTEDLLYWVENWHTAVTKKTELQKPAAKIILKKILNSSLPWQGRSGGGV